MTGSWCQDLSGRVLNLGRLERMTGSWCSDLSGKDYSTLIAYALSYIECNYIAVDKWR
jgi:hypothetical protein